MAIQLQIRRGTTAENDVFTGAVGELTMDTDTNGVRVHDGTTAGGVKIPTEATADYVVEWQAPTDLNNYTWYRKYKSGWVEQGGQQTSDTGFAGVTVTLPVAMADANYTITATVTGAETYFVGCLNKTATSFLWRSFDADRNGYDRAGSWQVSGMAA